MSAASNLLITNRRLTFSDEASLLSAKNEAIRDLTFGLLTQLMTELKKATFIY
jgi:hypothetical protein